MIDPATGAEQVETVALPLTTHRPGADLWVHDYQTILFDRAKHAWCADPDNLSAPARAFYEPRWRAMAARSEEHTSDLQSLMRTSSAVFCLTKKQMYTHT